MSALRIGIDTGGTFTDFVRLGRARPRRPQAPHDARRSVAGDPRRPRRLSRRGGRAPTSCTDPPSRPTPCSSARARASRSSRPRASRTCCASAGRRGRALQHLRAAAAAARRPGADVRPRRAARRRRAACPRRRSTPSARCGCPRSSRRAAPTSSRSACCTPTSIPRTRRASPRGCARRAGSVSASSRSAARVSRVRAVEHDRRQRLRDAAHRSLSRRARDATGPARVSRSCSRTADRFPPRLARAQAVRTVLSGPAAGVVGAQAVARAAGFDRVISFDMGGTSTDVSLIDGAIADDRPIRGSAIFRCGCRSSTSTRSAPAADRSPIVDTGGALRVGPRQRRVGARAGLLRHRHRADGDGRESAARPARSGVLPRRPHDARRRARAEAAAAIWRGA